MKIGLIDKEQQQIAEEERKAREKNVLLEFALDIITEAQEGQERQIRESEAESE